MSGIFNPLQDNNQLTIDYATYELSLVLASGSPLVLESGGFNINLGTGIINNSGALEFDTTINYNFSGLNTFNNGIILPYNASIPAGASNLQIGDTADFNGNSQQFGIALPAGATKWAFQIFAGGGTSAYKQFYVSTANEVGTKNNILDNGSGLATLTTLNLVNVLDAQYINISNTLINNGGALDVNIDNTYIIQNSGVLSINLTENYTWTGQHQFNNTTDYTMILAAELGNIYGALTLPGSAAFSLLNNLVFDAGVGTGGYNPLGWDAISNFAHNYRVYASYGAGSTYTFNNGGANVANIIGGGLSYNVEGSTASIPSPHRVGFNVNAGATGGSTGLGVLVSNAALTLGSTYDLSGGSAIDTLLGFGLFGSSSGYCSGFLDFTAYGGNTAYVYFFVQGTNYGHYINHGELWVIH